MNEIIEKTANQVPIQAIIECNFLHGCSLKEKTKYFTQVFPLV